MSLLFLLLTLLPVALAVWHLRRHRHAPPEGGVDGVLRWLAIAMLVCFVAGFGVCGAWGLFAGVSMVIGSGRPDAYSPIFLIMGGGGLAIAALAAWLFRRLIRPSDGAQR